MAWIAALPSAALMKAFDVATTSLSSSVCPIAVVESPSCTWMTTSALPSPEKSESPPKTLCHSREPRKTAPTTMTTNTQSVAPRTKRRLRRRRASRMRSARLNRRRGGPTAMGCGRSRSQPSGIADLVECCSSLIQPALQYADGGGLVDHRLLSPCSDTGFPQRALRGDGGQPFVSHPHRRRRDTSRQVLCEGYGVLRRRTGSV